MPVIPPVADAPRQAIASYLIELLADEWMVVPGFWERWHYSLEGNEPNHLSYNEMQWGSVFAAGAPGEARRAAGADLFKNRFGISEARINPRGVYAGLVHLGYTRQTESAWWAARRGHRGSAEGLGGTAQDRRRSHAEGPGLHARLLQQRRSGATPIRSQQPGLPPGRRLLLPLHRRMAPTRRLRRPPVPRVFFVFFRQSKSEAYTESDISHNLSRLGVGSRIVFVLSGGLIIAHHRMQHTDERHTFRVADVFNANIA
jgi:hypothetical protein